MGGQRWMRPGEAHEEMMELRAEIDQLQQELAKERKMREELDRNMRAAAFDELRIASLYGDGPQLRAPTKSYCDITAHVNFTRRCNAAADPSASETTLVAGMYRKKGV